ncbi:MULTISPECIES: mercury resistance system transport protein MerF [Cyanophyceae]|uniref:mercury resistance system transport protein MerF n=1 Tax=Cyanophyceae TaxID=3028117 RepID=UPI0002A66C16|nr:MULTISPECIES: mercury resistance system transport protein MerF [Cyanophyceae]AFZ33502.1 mercury ion transport transmembrane protein MerF [Gloeocapsa sp. PCC 7428]PPS42009.1 mercury transporter [Chroococcidiopsis sp. TS-821]
MKLKAALIASLTGTVIIALCYFTPVLVIGLGVIGLSAWIGYLDYVLLPTLGAMVGLTIVSYWRYRH